MGLRPLNLEEWIEWGDDAEFQLAEKTRLLRDRRGDVVMVRDGSLAACEELLVALQENLSEFHPKRRRGVDPADHPLVAASRLVPEDLCVLSNDSGEWRLVAASVCFPSRWALGDKIGRSLDQIHAPVPGYGDQLARPTTQFFDRLNSNRSFWRLNWTLLDDATLFLPAPSRSTPVADPAEWLFRVERQTLRRLRNSGAVVFSIRTIVRPVHELVSLVPTFAADVLTVLSSAPDETLAYKGWTTLAHQWAERYPESSN
jgi:hypothetical protein